MRSKSLPVCLTQFSRFCFVNIPLGQRAVLTSHSYRGKLQASSESRPLGSRAKLKIKEENFSRTLFSKVFFSGGEKKKKVEF